MATNSEIVNDLNGFISSRKEDESSDDEPCAKKFKSDNDAVETCETKAQTSSDSLQFEAKSTAKSTTEKTEEQTCENDDMEMESVEPIPEKSPVEAAGNTAVGGSAQTEASSMSVSKDISVSSENKEELLDQTESSVKESSKEEISVIEKIANTSLEESFVKDEVEIVEMEQEVKASSEEGAVEESAEKEMSDAEKEAKTNSKKDPVEEVSALEDEKKGKAKCWSCKKNEAIYTCPGCLIKTCSLPCVNFHKEQQNCDGIRNPITHITKKSDYKETDFVSDYRFLERVNQQLTRNTDEKRTFNKSWLTKKLNTALHYGVTLHFLPQSFSRGKANKSLFHFKTKVIFWDVEWVFMNGDIKKHHHRCPAEKLLDSAMSKYLDLSNEDYDHRLDEYLKVKRSGGENFRFYLRREFQPAEDKYVQLRGGADFYNNLRQQTIVEFPSIHVVLPRHFEHYEPFATVAPIFVESEMQNDDTNNGVMTS